MSYDKIPFKTNPDIQFNSLISEQSDCLAGSCNFEVFKDKKDQKTYIFTLYFDIDTTQQKYAIRIISLDDKKIIKELEGHEDRILNVRYFYNEITKNEYLVSADRKTLAIVWDITNDYKNIKKIKFNFDSFIYSNVLFFKNDSIFLISSSISNHGAKIVDITKDEKPKDITAAKNLSIYFMELWYNKNEERNYLIICGKEKITIIELFPKNNNSFMKEFTTTGRQPYNLGGLVYNFHGKNYFMSSSTFGGILIINLETMEQVGELKIFNGFNFYNIIKWNERYILILDSANKRIAVMDLNDYKIKNKLAFPELNCPRYIKKVIHQIYGEALIIITMDCKLNLYTNRYITNFKD